MSFIKIIIYSTDSGKEPYSEWEDDLDLMTQAIIKNRLDRIRIGNFGDAKILKGMGGIWELRINYGPGYRIYFGKQGTTIVVLLTGGDKKSQKKDIAKAVKYWLDYKELL
jgi:putative addiction module killer protein